MEIQIADPETLTRWQRRAAGLRDFALAAWDQIVRDKLIIRASGLAYTSLLAMVPLIAVAFALFTGFEAFADLKHKINDMLLERLLPTGQDQITQYIDTFVNNSRDLGLIGFVFLIVTAILLLDNIDWNFNEIWHVQSRRGLISRLTAYTSVLVFGTVLIGLSMTISARIRSALFTAPGLELGTLNTIGSWGFSVASSFLAFLLMFVIIPATRVRVSSAAIGAAFSAVTWELGKNVFAVSIGESVRYSTLYGSLATIPIFLIWLYLTWILILAGLEVAYTHQNRYALVQSGLAGEPTDRDRLELALKIMTLVSRRFNTGDAPPTEEDLVHLCTFEGAAPTVGEVTGTLESAGLVRRSCGDSGHEGLVPAAPLDGIAATDVINAVWGCEPGAATDENEPDSVARELVEKFDAAGRKALEGLTFNSLAEREPEE